MACRPGGARVSWVVLLGLACGGSACAGQGLGADPDPDATPARARVLQLGESRSDSLECRRGDCADWHEVELARGGELEVEVELSGLSEGDGLPSAILIDPAGVPLVRLETLRSGPGRGLIRYRLRVRPGIYRCGLLAGGSKRVAQYRLLLGQVGSVPLPEAPRPKPR